MMTNSIINRTGITLAHELVRETGLKPVHIGLAYVAVRDMFGLRAQWKAIESLSGKVDAAMQMRLFTRMNQFIAHQMRWLLAHHAEGLSVSEVTARYQKDLGVFAGDIDALMSQSLRQQCKKLCDEYSDAGVPKALAATISRMEAMSSSLDILETAYSTKRSIRDVAQAYFELGSLLRLGWLRQLVRNIPAETYWQRQAGTALKSELYQAQRRITLEVLRAAAKKKPADAVASWQASREGLLTRYSRFAQELEGLTRPDFATLTVAMRQVQAITG
jgi:glutamate dehydrogenase